MHAPAVIRGPIRLPLAISAVLLVGVMYFAREVLIPIALAALLSFLLAPLVRRLERYHVPRGVAVFLAMCGAIVVTVVIGWIIELQVMQVASRLPEIRAGIRQRLQTFRPPAVIADAADKLAAVHDGAPSAPSAPPASQAPQSKPGEAPIPVVPMPTSTANVATDDLTPVRSAWAIVSPLVKPVLMGLAVFVFAVFMLLTREDLRSRFLRLVGERDMHLSTTALDDAAQRVSRYLRTQLLINAAVGFAIGLGLHLVGLPQAALWGLLVTVLRFVPYVGVWIAASLPLGISLAESTGWTQPALALVIVLVVEIISSNVIEPPVIGAGTGLSPLAVLTSAAFWTWLWGPVGLVLATPLTVCVAVIGKHVPRLAFLDVLLGDEPVLSLEARCYQRLLAGDQEEATQLIEGFAKDHTLVEVFDTALLPTLRLVEQDHQRGVLEEEREATIIEMLTAIIDDLGNRPAPTASVTTAASEAPAGTPNSTAAGAATAPATARAAAIADSAARVLAPAGRGRILCVPARDIGDELAGRMLEQLLAREGVHAQLLSADVLTSEVVSAIGDDAPAAVCISALPPAAAVHVRVLCRRLRSRFPDLPILVGLWDNTTDVAAARARLGELATENLVTRLEDAIGQLRGWTVTTRPSPDAPTESVGHTKS